MTERTKRRRVVVKDLITDELVDLFRAAIPGYVAHCTAIRASREYTSAELSAWIGPTNAFRRAIDFPLWERFSPLDPLASGEWRELQAQLLAKIAGSEEEKAWRAYARKLEKERAKEQTEDRKRGRKNSGEDTSRLEPNLRWAKSTKGGW